MSDYDIVEVIREPYDPRFQLWKREGLRLEQGDKVPIVGMAPTYAVRLHSQVPAPARYLWVQDGVITNPMAHQPIGDASVFDAWGRYLGRGGSPLDPPATGTWEQVLIREFSPSSSPSPVEASPTPTATTEMLMHRFHLRQDLEIQVSLPADLDERDVGRLCVFLRSLPFASEKTP